MDPFAAFEYNKKQKRARNPPSSATKPAAPLQKKKKYRKDESVDGVAQLLW